MFIPDAFEAWASQHHLAPTILAGIAVALAVGFSKTHIARTLGLSRQTVYKYCRVLREAPPEEWLACLRDLLTFNPGPVRGSVRP